MKKSSMDIIKKYFDFDGEIWSPTWDMIDETKSGEIYKPKWQEIEVDLK